MTPNKFIEVKKSNTILVQYTLADYSPPIGRSGPTAGPGKSENPHKFLAVVYIQYIQYIYENKPLGGKSMGLC